MRHIIVLLFSFSIFYSYGQGFKVGKKIFQENCASCHKMDKKLVGPPLQNTVKEQGREWTNRWISNSQSLIKSGDKHANQIYNEYNKMAMPAYAGVFSEEELESLLDYLQEYSTKTTDQASTKISSTPPVGQTAGMGGSVPVYVWVLLGCSVLVVFLSLFVLKAALDTVLTLIRKPGRNDDETKIETYIDREVNKRLDGKIKAIKKNIVNNLDTFK